MLADVSRPTQRRASAVDALVDQIRQLIWDEGLSVGDTLPSERELGERFAAARNTVREAVGVLRAYGVVDVRPKVGAVIVDRHLDAISKLFSFQIGLSKDSFLDIQGFRRLLEVGIAETLIDKVNAEDIERLDQINREIVTSASVGEAAAKDYEFHVTMLGIAGNATLVGVYRSMQPLISRLMETGKATDGLEGTFETHNGILDALKRRDRLAFQYRMDRHLSHGLKYIDGSVR